MTWRKWMYVTAMVALSATAASAQTGQLTVSMTVQSSISIIFRDSLSAPATGFCPLSNTDTANVGLDLGTARFNNGTDTLSCVAFNKIGAFYTVSSGFDVVVTKANTTSPNYRLDVSMSTVPPANMTWQLGSTTLTTSYQPLSASNNYATRVAQTLSVTVKNNVAAGAYQETIYFLATAN